MSQPLRLACTVSLALFAACDLGGTTKTLDGGHADGGFILVEDPPVADAGHGKDGGSASADGGSDGGSTACGNGKFDADEACDDGNTAPGDGCSPSCQVEPGFACKDVPSNCTSTCGDKVKASDEQCDDGNTAPGDGCSNECLLEPGYSCPDAGVTCGPTCGDGKRLASEACDDGNTDSGDGCSATCTVEAGFTCTDAAGCVTTCGDGVKVGLEECDDKNTSDGDGCSALCELEPGYACTGSPSACAGICGDGLVLPPELCDDGNLDGGDGCSATCGVERGYVCTSAPSDCVPNCGDGILAGAEACDDHNAAAGDGCDETCAVETGFTCSGEPSTCVTHCGDGIIAGSETCDDGNKDGGDGCTAACSEMAGWTCLGTPSQCTTTCGDGLVAGSEQCEPGVNPGTACGGLPCGCTPACTALGGLTVLLDGGAGGDTVTVTGDGGFSPATVASGDKLTELDPGLYTVTGEVKLRSLDLVDEVLDPPAPVTVNVVGGALAAANFAWTLRGGTGRLWVGTEGASTLGLSNAALGGGSGTRTVSPGGTDNGAVVALQDGTLVFGGVDGTGKVRLVTYSPASLASNTPSATSTFVLGTNISYPAGVTPSKVTALATAPGGSLFAAVSNVEGGTTVLKLPTALKAGAPLASFTLAGDVKALELSEDTALGTFILWVAEWDGNSTSSVTAYNVGSITGALASPPTVLVTLAPTANLTTLTDFLDVNSAALPFGQDVALGLSRDGTTLWVADSLAGSTRLQNFSLGSTSGTLEATAAYQLTGYSAPAGLAVGNLVVLNGAASLVLADRGSGSGGSLLLVGSQALADNPSGDVVLATSGPSALVSVLTAGSPGTVPLGLAFSPPRPPAL